MSGAGQGIRAAPGYLFVTVDVNGRRQRVEVPAAQTLLELLRETLGLTGTKRGCDHGSCGCCTVHLDGQPVLSCLLLTAETEGAAVTTIEGVSRGGDLHPLQDAMIEHGAIQCGFCTPAMVMNGIHLLQRDADPSAEAVKRCVSGTICRCTGYTKIVRAVLAAAAARRGEGTAAR